MQIASSARRTCMASVSAVEWTATVLIPISWQARGMRSAISPRLAMRILPIAIPLARLLDDRERLVVLDRLGVLDEDPPDHAPARRGDRVHHLHRLDDQQRVALVDLGADGHERRRAGLAGKIAGPD